MIAVARNISYGEAYENYITRKDMAVFVGAKNMVANTELFVSNDQLDDLWEEFQESGRDYVRRGKDVTNNIIAIEYSPTSDESENWTKQEWFAHAEELLKEIDSVDHKKAKRNPKTKEWIVDDKGKKVLFPVEHTQLNNSKWMAMLHRDSASGIYHLHIAVSRYREDNKLNCVTDIAKRAAIAAENINKRYGWTQAMDIRQRHADEINAVINQIMAEMPDDLFNPSFFKSRIENCSYTDYKGNRKNYTCKFHTDKYGMVDGYAIGRGKSTFTALELGQKIKAVPIDYVEEIEDTIYDILRTMGTPKFDWDKFIEMLEARTYMAADGQTKHYQFEGRPNPNGGYYNYSIIRDGKKYNASQIGTKLTAAKISREYEKERKKTLEKARQESVNMSRITARPPQSERPERPFIRYGNVNVENVEEVVRNRLRELGIKPSNVYITERTELYRNVKDYLTDAVDSLNRLDKALPHERQNLADKAFTSAQAAVAKHNRNMREQVKSEAETSTAKPATENVRKPVEPTNVKPIQGKRSEVTQDRQNAIASANDALRKWAESGRAIFNEIEENILGLGMAAKCIENGQSPWIDANMEGAARELGNDVADRTSTCVLRMTQLAGEILLGIAMPEDVSLGGGGGGNNDLSKKKDDEWLRFKPAFGMRPAKKIRRD